jgi:hypothetical protein
MMNDFVSDNWIFIGNQCSDNYLVIINCWWGMLGEISKIDVSFGNFPTLPKKN